MTYYATALTNDKSELIVETMQTTDAFVADLIADMWEDMGYKVVRREED